jgi:hypothetical protein
MGTESLGRVHKYIIAVRSQVTEVALYFKIRQCSGGLFFSLQAYSAMTCFNLVLASCTR